jgi:hypothetical protein
MHLLPTPPWPDAWVNRPPMMRWHHVIGHFDWLVSYRHAIQIKSMSISVTKRRVYSSEEVHMMHLH